MAGTGNNKILYQDFFDESLQGKLILLRKEFEQIRKYAGQMKKAQPVKLQNSADLQKVKKAREELNKVEKKYETTQKELLKVEKQIQVQSVRNTKEYQQRAKSLKKLREEGKRAEQQERARKRASEQLEKQRQRALAQQAKQEFQEKELIKVAQMEVKSIEDLRAKTNALVKLRDKLDLTTKDGRRQFDLFTKAIKRNSQALLKAEAAAGRYNRNVGNYAGGLVRGVGRVAGAFGVMGGMYGGAMALQNMVKTNAEFEQSMAKVRAITQATGPDFQKLRMNALELGATTLYTATEIAGLQSELGKLGFSVNEIVVSTEAVQNLSAATLEELSTSAMVAGATLRGFQLDAKQMTRVTDTMAASFTNSALDLSNFTESMKYVAPVAKSAGVSIEEATAMLSAMADAGLKGSMAGTALRRIMSEIGASGKPVAEALKEMAARGMNLANAADEVGRHAQTALLVLADNMDKVERLTEVYNNSAGAAERMAQIQRDTLRSSVTLLGSAWDGLMMRFSNTNSLIKDVVDGLTGLVNIMTRAFGNENIKNIEEEQTKVNGLVVEYSNANTSLERRRQILTQLGKINKDIVEGLDAENVEYRKLNENLTAYNEGVVQRIMLEKLKEDEKDAAVDLADAQLKSAEAQRRLNTALSMYNKEIALNPEMNLKEKIEATRKAIKEEQALYEQAFKDAKKEAGRISGTVTLTGDAKKYQDLENILMDISTQQTVLKWANEDITALEEQQVNLTKKQLELKRILGLIEEDNKDQIEQNYNLQAMSLKQLQELMETANIEKNEGLKEMIQIEIDRRKNAFLIETELYKAMMKIKSEKQQELFDKAHEAAKKLGDESVSIILDNIDMSAIYEDEKNALEANELLYQEAKISYEQFEANKLRIAEQYAAFRQRIYAQEIIARADQAEAEEWEPEVPEEEPVMDDAALRAAMGQAMQEKEFRLRVLESLWERGEIGWQEYTQRVNEINEQAVMKDTATLQNFVSIGSSLLNSLSKTFQTEERQKQDALERRYKAGQMADEEYQKRKAALEEQAAKEEKKRQLSQAYIQGAQVILNALQVQPWWLALSQAVIAEVMVSKQIQQIKKQKFAEGEIDIQGPSHDRGGIPAEIEGGESVINKKGTRAAKETLTLINEGVLTDEDVISAMMVKDRMIVGQMSVDMIRKDNETIRMQKELLAETKQTNSILKRWKIVSQDGKTIIDLNGNKVRYV